MKTAGVLFRKLVFGGWIFLCLILVNSANGRVTPQIPSLTKRSIFSEPTKAVPGPEKNFTGIRLKQDSLWLIYYHEQTVAVVEVAPNRALFNCELLEVRTKADKRVALDSLKPVIPTQIKIKFTDMMDLMTQCQKLDPPLYYSGRTSENKKDESSTPTQPRQLVSIFSGVFPGTKWCGAGDIATSYHDLGPDRELDKCCRSHDLCPVKVAGLRTQYNLTNYAIYTRSHCICDDFFYNCLKSLGTTVSGFLGNIYFNVAPLTCVEDVLDANSGSKTKKQFTIKNKRF